MNFFRPFFVFVVVNFSITSFMHAALVQVNGKWTDAKYAPTLSLAEHYDRGMRALTDKQWDEALQNFLVITTNFPDSPFYAESVFNSGVCYYFLGDFDLANKQLSHYLNLGGNLKFFEKAFEFKYYIADYFSKGKKRHFFGIKSLPKWVPAKKLALEIYDEVIASLPGKELAAKSLYGKALVLKERREYRDSIEALQTITRRFPKTSLAADAYLMISDIYIEQSQVEAQNPDLLSLAQINLSRFQKSFPGDERIPVAQGNLSQMTEVLSKSLYDTGRFYEKKKKKGASKIYYNEAIRRYPQSGSAEKSKERLAKLFPEESRPAEKVIVQE